MDEVAYTPDAERVCAYLQEITDGAVGCGEDPVGFLITSHRALAEANRWHDMASAPKDGTRIDLMFPHPRGRKVDCFWGASALAGFDTWLWRTATWERGSHEPLPEEQWEIHCLPNMQPLAWRYSPPTIGAAPLLAPAGLQFPRELTPELMEVLGMPNFRTGPMAHAFRDAGRATIRPKCEDEQAFILHWLATLVLEHGADWRRHAGEALDAVIAEAKAARAERQAAKVGNG